MSTKAGDMTPLIDLTQHNGAGAFRTRRPVYVDLMPPCNHACPAGENIQAWLQLAQAGRFRQTWEALVSDNPIPAVHGRVCYHPCENACNRGSLDASVSIHAIERYLGDLATQQGWPFKVERASSGKRLLIVPNRISLTSSHAWGLAQAIELARTLHLAPREIIVYAIEGGSFERGAALTPAVAAAARVVAERNLAEVDRLRYDSIEEVSDA